MMADITRKGAPKTDPWRYHKAENRYIDICGGLGPEEFIEYIAKQIRSASSDLEECTIVINDCDIDDPEPSICVFGYRPMTDSEYSRREKAIERERDKKRIAKLKKDLADKKQAKKIIEKMDKDDLIHLVEDILS